MGASRQSALPIERSTDYPPTMLTREFTAAELSTAVAFDAFVKDLGGVAAAGRVCCLKVRDAA